MKRAFKLILIIVVIFCIAAIAFLNFTSPDITILFHGNNPNASISSYLFQIQNGCQLVITEAKNIIPYKNSDNLRYFSPTVRKVWLNPLQQFQIRKLAADLDSFEPASGIFATPEWQYYVFDPQSVLWSSAIPVGYAESSAQNQLIDLLITYGGYKDTITAASDKQIISVDSFSTGRVVPFCAYFQSCDVGCSDCYLLRIDADGHVALYGPNAVPNLAFFPDKYADIPMVDSFQLSTEECGEINQLFDRMTVFEPSVYYEDMSPTVTPSGIICQIQVGDSFRWSNWVNYQKSSIDLSDHEADKTETYQLIQLLTEHLPYFE